MGKATTKKTTNSKAAPRAVKPAAKAPLKPAKPVASGLGLRSAGNLSSLLTAPPGAASTGAPLSLSIDMIDEDPNQPRTEDNPGFTAESIAEIGATIKARGVKSPISVRENPEQPGRYLINHGARRYRGSKWAGKKTIPAFVDNNYNQTDQVIENLQRNELTAREIADFIGRELAAGKKKGDIAESLGKSGAFVSQHVALLDLPDPVAEAFNAGRSGDVTVINELVKAYKSNPAEVTNWLSDPAQELTRGSVRLLREFLDEKAANPNKLGNGEGAGREDGPGATTQAPPREPKLPKEVDPTALKKAIVQVRHDGRPARLMLGKRPAAEGYGWLKYDDDGHEFESHLRDVSLISIVEGQ